MLLGNNSFLGGTASSATGDAFEAPVAWSGGDLAAMAGRTVRMRLNLTRAEGIEPRLFAATLRAAP
ncbi:MAG: hypothetical protein RIS54_2269 [Verrucomicrobiota bacterium]|jgi:hypothetical protein